MLNRICTALEDDAAHAMRLLTQTNDMQGSCTTSNMNIHDVGNDNDERMRAGCVFRCWLCDLGELTAPAWCGDVYRIRIYLNLQQTTA